jgi:hypothetical protein
MDSRPRRMALVLPSSLPLPLLSTIFNTIFNRFQAPLISLFSSAAMTTVAAGLRTALVVDLGWAETTVTSVYDYREVRCTRTVRSAKTLVDALHQLIKEALNESTTLTQVISFEECEDLACRFLWCRRPGKASVETSSTGLPTLHEQDESDVGVSQGLDHDGAVTIPLRTSKPPTNLQVPLQRLAELCEKQFLDPQCIPASFDDHELPVHLLIYRHLLQLPMDARAACMSRIVFTGGCANIVGLKGRIFDEVSSLVLEKGWDAVQGKGVQQLRSNPKVRRPASKQGGMGPVNATPAQDAGEQDGVWHDAANAVPEVDPIEQQLRKANGRDGQPEIQGVLRCAGSLGPWGGTSLVCQLKIPAMATIDRELWLLHGVNGASRPSEVDVTAQRRQSMGPGGLMRAASGAGQYPWTLGSWGNH